MNDIHVTIIAVLGMLLALAVVFDICFALYFKKLSKKIAEKDLEIEAEKIEIASLKNKIDGLNSIKFQVTAVETFAVEPVILKNKTSFSDYISMDEDTKTRILYEDLAKGLVDIFLENPNYVQIIKEENPMFCNKTYISTIRLIPFKEV